MANVLTVLISILIIILPIKTFAHSEAQVVKMTPSGFEPQQVETDADTTVIFINQDTKARWPASNVHPTHEIYPEFDPKHQIEPGKDWSFKPEKAGEWRFHDHLIPHFRGVLKVQGEGNFGAEKINPPKTLSWLDPIKRFFENLITKAQLFLQKPNREKQVKRWDWDISKLSPDEQLKITANMAKDIGAEEVWRSFKQKFKGQAGSSGNIHDLAHLSGKLIYEEKGFDGIKSCSGEFAFGCFHGFLDQAFVKSLDDLDKAEDACSKIGNGGPVASCIHGIGHGVASFYSTSDLKSSLSSCRKLQSGREYCFDGVFMEFARSAPESAYKKDNPYYPCDELEDNFGPTYSFSCGRNQPSILMGKFQMGFDEVVKVCLNSTSKPFKQACFDALGFSLASTADSRQIIAGCQKINDPEMVSRCSRAAAGELIFQEIPGWEEKSQQVCHAFAGKEECLTHLEMLIRDYGRKKKLTFTPFQGGDENEYIRQQLWPCYNEGGRDGCYREIANIFYGQFGLSKTLKLLKSNEDYPEVYARCHEVTHYISRLEYEKQKDIAKVYNICDSTCHGGCYHGTLEAYLKTKQLYEGVNLMEHFPKVCGKKQDYQKPLEYYECLHGLGHAAMFVTDMELFQSLKYCDTLNEQDHKERCYSGVFMENSSSSTSFDHQSKYIKKDDPFYPCNSLEEKYQQLCWQYQSSYFAIIKNQDFAKVAQLCLQIPGKYHDKCFRTIGTNQVGFTQSLKTMKDNCNMMPNDHFKDICVAGVISSMAYRFVGDSQKMVEFCSIVDEGNKENCYKQMGTSFMDWTTNKEEAKSICMKIPDQKGLSWCQNAI